LQVGEYFYKEMMKIKKMKLAEHKAMHVKHIWDKFVMTSI
jgi:hypothetical protein